MTAKTETEDRLLSQTELAERWGITRRTLQVWHTKGKGPKRLEIGRKFYRLSDVIAYEEEQTVEAGARRGQSNHKFDPEIQKKGTEASRLARAARKAQKPT